METSTRTAAKRCEYQSPSHDDGGEHVEYFDEERWAVQAFAEELAHRLTDADLAEGDQSLRRPRHRT